MDMPRLSLCIPTYNRVKYLRELLPPLLAEVEMANGDVLRIEVVVSNNDSADETDGYVSSLSSPALVYQRNPSNIGAICNFHACIDRARGDYIWLFGDDELFEPGGITRLLDCLDHDQPALVVLRDASRPDAGKGLMVYSGYRECLLQEMQANAAFALSHTLITANVFRKDVFDQPTVKAKQTSAYGQMYALAAGLQRGGKVAVLDGVMRVRVRRAQFTEGWPMGLCVRQGIYLRHLARMFDVPALRQLALRLFAHLPIEILSICAHKLLPRLWKT